MAMDGNATGGLPRFSVGTVIRASLAVLRANAWTFLGIILGVGLPAGLLLMVAVVGLAGGQSPSISLENASGNQILALIIVGLVGMIAYFLILTALTFGALQSLRGRKAGIGACLSHGLSALPRAVLAGLIFSVVMGLVAFIVSWVVGAVTGHGALAGIVLMAVFAFVVVVFWVFLPVVVVERVGPIDCFFRSNTLTKGHRWSILGILALVVAANLVAKLFAIGLGMIGAPAASGVLDFAASLFFLALGAVLAAVGYYLLRAEKEGFAEDDLVKVFD